jgi:hypothetical protein
MGIDAEGAANLFRSHVRSPRFPSQAPSFLFEERGLLGGAKRTVVRASWALSDAQLVAIRAAGRIPQFRRLAVLRCVAARSGNKESGWW